MPPADSQWQRMARRYLVRFRGPVLIDEGAVRELCRYARQGYDTPRKRETYGFLFGALTDDGRIVVRRSCYYRGGIKTRTGVVFKDWPTVSRIGRRRRELAAGMRMRYLGSFHSHVEIAGAVFKGISDEDRDSFASDPMSTLEVIVFIWHGTHHCVERSRRDIVGYESNGGYNYRIRCYAKSTGGVRQASIKVVPSGVTIVG